MATLYLGIDLSITKTGWAIISVEDGKPSIIDFGLLTTDAKMSDGERLRTIVDGLRAIVEEYPDINESVAREKGIVKFPLPTMQVFKAHGATEYALVDYSIEDVPIATVKAWARRVTGSPGKRNDKAMVAEAVTKYYGEPIDFYTKRGKLIDDISDAIAVMTVWLVKNGIIERGYEE